jgi:hypothetical protein
MVENGSEPSITMSFTYYTDATRRDSLLHRTHYRMRQWGIAPPAVGRHPWLDALMHSPIRGVADARMLARKLLGRAVRSDRAAYAYSDVH